MPPKRLICSVCRRKFGTENAGWTHIAFKHSGTGAELNIQENIQSFMVILLIVGGIATGATTPPPSITRPSSSYLLLFALNFLYFKVIIGGPPCVQPCPEVTRNSSAADRSMLR